MSTAIIQETEILINGELTTRTRHSLFSQTLHPMPTYL